ncbi:MAG: FAD binding domain-containing protein [Desulfovermiculus sp.]
MGTEVFLPQSLPEFWDVHGSHPDAAIYHGGTDVLVRLKEAGRTPPAYICLERIPELQAVQDCGEELFVGAGLTHAQILIEPNIATHWPLLPRAVAVLGSPPIRHAGTLGGNLGTASPAGDTLPPLYCLQAEVHLVSASGRRSLNIQDFIRGPGHTALQPGELILGVQAPKAGDWGIQHFEKVGLRKAMTCSLASLAALIKTAPDGYIQDIRLAWGSLGPTVICSKAMHRKALGKPLNIQTLNSLADLLQEKISPIDDQRASGHYRRQLAPNLLLRLVQETRLPSDY